MKKNALLYMGLALATIGLLLVGSSIAHGQDKGEFTVPLSDPAKRGKLKAYINSGSITVKGTARKDVLVRYTSGEDKEIAGHHRNNDNDNDNGNNASMEGLKKISSGTIDLEVTESENFVKVESQSWNKEINLEIEVPSGVDLQVHTYNNGDLIIQNIQGELELNNFNGEITAENISGAVVATTYNGAIKTTFDKVKEGAPMSFSTFNGDIDLMFPSTLKATLKMKTDRGEIFSGFDVNLVKGGPVQKKEVKTGTYKVTLDEWVRGDIGGGGAEIAMKTYNGDILVRKK